MESTPKRLSCEQFFRWWFHVLRLPTHVDSEIFVNAWWAHTSRIKRYLAKQRKFDCKDCRQFIPGLMSLDHLPQFTRSLDFSDAKFYPIEAVVQEVAKTEVVCRPCHDLREIARQGHLPKPEEPPEYAAFGKICYLLAFLGGAPPKAPQKPHHDYRKHRHRNAYFKMIFNEEASADAF